MSILDRQGNALVSAMILSGLVGAGIYVSLSVAKNQLQSEGYRRFSLEMQNLNIRAEAILHDTASCESAFKGQPLPTVSSPVRSKLPDGGIAMILEPGYTGPAPMKIGDAIHAQLEIKDIRLIADGHSPETYSVEIVAGRPLSTLAVIGGITQLVRRFPLHVEGAGTIATCDGGTVESIPWETLCASLGQKYDPATKSCTACPKPGEIAVAWAPDGTPDCEAIDEIACKTLDPKLAFWISATSTCFTCSSGWQNVVVDASGNPSCEDSIDVPALIAAINGTCPAGKTKQIVPGKVLRVECL